MASVMQMARLMQGNEAVAEAAIAAGVNFYAGYPITPSTEIAEFMARKLPLTGGVFIQMEDEISSMAAIIGASLTGAKAITATSGPGFSLMQENIGYAVMAEVPCVIINVMRLGPSTGMPTAPGQGDVMQARWGTHGDHPVIALCPSSVTESYELTVRAVNLAERFRTPVILLLDEVVAHLRERIILPAQEDIKLINRVKPAGNDSSYLPYRPIDNGIPPMSDIGGGYRHNVTGLVHDERGIPSNDPGVAGALISRLMTKVADYTGEIYMSDGYLLEDAEIAVVAYGAVARSARRAVKEARQDQIAAGLWRPVSLWPFPGKEIEELSRRVRCIIVAEMNSGQMAGEVERHAGGRCPVVSLAKVNGELIAPGEIHRRIREVYTGA
ncbi:MAG: 2-oxoglutarate ferredoxin oxidoreductase subunit alpha [Peptococcaceae bacterium BRH_c4b]|nr:MAG: 2-oxoglutarate ferredoxin oxidoreductase subunit alpha [Peptococcaceae bacterium BRH_c4b]